MALRDNAIKVVPSRFAALKIENDDDFADKNGHKSNGKNNNQQHNNKNKKNNSKKPQTPQSNNSNAKNEKKSNEKVKDWDEWKQKDDEFTDELFKEQLKTAMIESKIEFETNKKSNSSSKTESNVKAKAKKSAAMSLDAFHKLNENDLINLNDRMANEASKADEKSNLAIETFIENIDVNVEKILNKEHNALNIDKNNIANGQFYLSLQYKEELDKRDNEIKSLNQIINELKEEVNVVKKRNKQLAYILAEGEMKEKTDLFNQIEELTNIKNELGAQVIDFHKMLEQEKSKVHQLENDIKKMKSKN